MPVGKRKNLLYGLALPVLGTKCRWQTVSRAGETPRDLSAPLARVFRRHHAVGGCVQIIRDGRPAEAYFFGNASQNPPILVSPDTIFRTASIAKMACALLVMRLQTQGKLDVKEDISAFWGAPVRNPAHPDTPIPLASLLSHTSGIVDSPQYFRSFQNPVTGTALPIASPSRNFSTAILRPG
jgi:CubicO group peptidase (beta-lactamase class C family)